MKCAIAMSAALIWAVSADAQTPAVALKSDVEALPKVLPVIAPPPVRAKKAHTPRALGRVSAANRAATREPLTVGFLNALQVYPYTDGALYQLYAAPGAITDIALQPGEILGAVAVGDTARWVVGDTTSGSGASRRTHILLKPFSAGLKTNLVITTDRRSYHLSLTATDRTAMAGLSWTYPADGLIALTGRAVGADSASPAEPGFDLERMNFGYRISGDDPDWRPVRAFDDGRQTFIEFPAGIASGEAPPLFAIGAGGGTELVNYRQRGRFYIVDALMPNFELRLGLKKQVVVRISRKAAGTSKKGA